ncbi:MAG TPA: adenylate/guanylate cyclase domain-containing protein [Solirubrobacteraceae bacterium]|nr:adenylate/guanylate cyclase domain-containing protein [Solirubrobacteraceae bacterium]
MEAGHHTFLFADLVGFTAFTERVGDDAAADVAMAFKSAAAHAASELGCEVVKDLGDAVMIHGRDAARVVTLALRLAREMREEGWCPAIRMGIHSGSAVQRGADWYGQTVNIASRLAESAGSGEILMSVTTRDRLQRRTGVTIADRGARQFKHVAGALAVFAAA